MTDRTNPPNTSPNQNPNQNPQGRKRSTLTTVVVLIVLLGFFWLSREWSDNAGPSDASTEQPVAEQLPAPEAPAVENEADSIQADGEGSEASDADAAATGAENDDGALSDESSVGASDTESEVSESAVEEASGPRAPPGMATITQDELPPEALETMALIETDGPFPYSKDGSTFQNREGILPSQPNGYYSEYTVETPGSPDRGARRIVGGSEGELYYTDDHYASFSWIEQ
jgi:ribonuclease T1